VRSQQRDTFKFQVKFYRSYFLQKSKKNQKNFQKLSKKQIYQKSGGGAL